jgi:hypothetical protein
MGPEDEDDDESPRVYKNVPTWEEAISYLLHRRPGDSRSGDAPGADAREGDSGRPHRPRRHGPRSEGRRSERRDRPRD